MDESTQGVTLYGGFIFDLLGEYESLRHTCASLFAMASELDASQPTKPVPMNLYNDMCTWIETNLGSNNIRRAGRAIGKRAYDQMLQNGLLEGKPTPLRVLEALKQVAGIMIQDPKGRNWEIVESDANRIVMRRTQTYNCVLQEGLLLSLIEKTGVKLPDVKHAKCTRKGSEFCEYVITWRE